MGRRSMVEVEEEEGVKSIVVGGRRFLPEVRRLKDMVEVVCDKQFLEHADLNTALYFMFRDVFASEEDLRKIKERGLRYDITVMPPNTLGKEFVKTVGHYHPPVSPHSRISYPEIYEVLEGKAHFLLQKREIVRESEKENREAEERIVDVVVISAREGDKVVIPPNYGHVTINPAGETLKMANFVARHFASIYEPYRRKGGAAYFELTSGKFVKNERYGEVPEIRFLNAPSLDDFGIYHDTPMYELIREPHKLEFLTRPEKFKELFERALRRKADERVGVEK